MAKYEVNQKVVITKGEYRGVTGYIIECICYPVGLTDYSVAPMDNKAICYRIREEDILPVTDELQIIYPDEIQNPSQLDITKYLTENQMREICEKIFTERAEKFIDHVLSIRSQNGMSVVDQVLQRVADMYAHKLSPKFEEAFLNICNEEINRKVPRDPDYGDDTISHAVSFALQKVGEKYVEDHRSEMEELLKDGIGETAKTLIPKNLAYQISRRIDVKSIIEQILKEGINTIVS